MKNQRIVIGTRGSMLARWQANAIAQALQAAHPQLIVEEKVVVTEGDRLTTGPLWNAGGKGVWVKEIEAALANREIDIAVHSLKDVPAELLPGLAIIAIPQRADVRDVLVSRHGQSLAELPPGAKIGTTSLRRQCQLLALRRDVSVEILRGNLDTRLRKVQEGVLDAAILAAAGLDRLGYADRIAERFPIAQMLPAVGQGALAIEGRGDDEQVKTLCSVLRDGPTEVAVTAERAFLSALGASCRTPVGGLAVLDGQELTLYGLVGSVDGKVILRDHLQGTPSAPGDLGATLGQKMIEQGAAEILRQVDL